MRNPDPGEVPKAKRAARDDGARGAGGAGGAPSGLDRRGFLEAAAAALLAASAPRRPHQHPVPKDKELPAEWLAGRARRRARALPRRPAQESCVSFRWDRDGIRGVGGERRIGGMADLQQCGQEGVLDFSLVACNSSGEGRLRPASPLPHVAVADRDDVALRRAVGIRRGGIRRRVTRWEGSCSGILKLRSRHRSGAWNQ